MRKKKKIALITGVNGQDGSYLANYLLSLNYKVIGTVRSLNSKLWRLEYFNIEKKIDLVECNFTEPKAINNLMNNYRNIDEIYNLAAISFVYSSFNQPFNTFRTNLDPVLEFLEIIRKENRDLKFYQASTSEMYGDLSSGKLSELSPMRPSSPYAVAKLASFNLVKLYRTGYNIFASNGILFNHESPLRSDVFVTRKITKALSNYKNNLSWDNSIGNIYSVRDWGFAGDYVKGMHLINNYKNPDDFVLATGTKTTVKEFINKVASYLDIKVEWIEKTPLNTKCIDIKNGKVIFKTDKNYFRPVDVNYLLGDNTKAKNLLKWKPAVKLDKMIKYMCDYDLKESIKHV